MKKTFFGMSIETKITRKLLPSLIILHVVLFIFFVYYLRADLHTPALIICALGITINLFVILFVISLKHRTDMETRKAMEAEILERTAALTDLNNALSEEIKERKKAERNVEAERKRFNDVIEMMPVYIILLTPDYHVAYANRFFRERFGESHGKRCFEYLFNRSEACELCETYKSLNENRSLTWEWTGPDNRIYSIYDFPFTDYDGAPMILEMGVDITSLKEAQADMMKMNVMLEERVRGRTRELEKSSKRLKILSDTSSRLLESGNPRDLINELCNTVMSFLDCHVFFNYMIDENAGKLHLHSFAGIPEKTAAEIEWLGLGVAVCGRVARDCKKIIAEDIQNHTDPATALVKSFGVQAYVCHPLMSGDKVLGTLSFGTKSRPVFSDEDISMMKTVADEVAIALSRVKYEDSLRESLVELFKLNRTLDSLSKSSKIVMHSGSEKEYLDGVCKIIVEDCGHAMVWIGYARDDAEKNVEPVAYSGFEEGYIDSLKITWADNERGRGPTGTAIRTGKITLCRDMKTDQSFAPWRTMAISRGYASSIVLPLKNGNKVFGSLSIYSEQTNHFSDEEIRLLSEIANDLAYGITYKRLMESEKKAVASIIESEEKYRLLFESMSEGFALHEIVTDDKGTPCNYRFLSINPAFEKQTGLKAVDLVGKLVTDVLPETEQYWIDTYGKVALNGKSVEFENYSNALNKYFRVSAFSPEIGIFATIFENITDRKLAEKELCRTKNYLENLINYANAPIIVWDTGKRIRLFNHAFEHLTGYLAAEVMGRKLDILFPKNMLHELNKKISDALSKNLITVEIPILTKKRKVRTVLWNSANIYDEDNETIISTIAQGNDITERNAAEYMMRSSTEKLNLALQNGNIGTWEFDVESGTMELDDRMKMIFGITRGTYNGAFSEFEKFLADDDIPHIKKAISEALENNVSFDTIYRIYKNGSLNYISSKASVVRDTAGKPIKLSGVCFDITEMKKGAENALFRLNEDLLRSNRELEQFAYVASHDLQEPLRMVSSFTQLLQLRYNDKLDDDGREFIKFAVDGAVRMQNLINDLLHFSRIETRAGVFGNIDMNNVLAHAVNNLKFIINEKDGIITNDPMPVIIADEIQIIQLLQNLIGNSLKFCNIKPRVHISVREEADCFRFSVSDNGIGIESQYYEKIFRIFQRLMPKDQYGGTGIGLAICKRIVERHGGKIWVESAPDEGSVFYFTIMKKQP